MSRRPACFIGARLVASLARDRSGASALVTGLLITVVLGFVGLGIDAGLGYLAKRSAQNAADSAAFTGAAALVAGAGDVVAQARAIATGYGFTSGTDGVQVSVNTPPASGAYAGDAKAVEVIIVRPGRSFFSGLFGGIGQIRGRAVARAGATGNACVIALHDTASAAASETGTAEVNLVGCSLFANSNSPSAFEMKGGASISADSIGLVGGYSLSNNAEVTTLAGIHTGEQAIEDPYKDVPVPAYAGCDYNSASFKSDQTIANSGVKVFCNGLQINSGATITLSPGVYVIDRGQLTVNGGGSLKGDGVTLVLTSSTGSGYATTQINGGAVLDLKAPASGPTQGLALYQDRRAEAGVENKMNGGTTQAILGAIYMPRQKLTFTGGASVATPGCTQILASEVAFLGNSTVGLNCTGAGVKMAGGKATALVE